MCFLHTKIKRKIEIRLQKGYEEMYPTLLFVANHGTHLSLHAHIKLLDTSRDPRNNL